MRVSEVGELWILGRGWGRFERQSLWDVGMRAGNKSRMWTMGGQWSEVGEAVDLGPWGRFERPGLWDVGMRAGEHHVWGEGHGWTMVFSTKLGSVIQWSYDTLMLRDRSLAALTLFCLGVFPFHLASEYALY